MDYPLRLADQLRAHLRALRKQRGLTQAQLGQRLGISQARVAEIEARPGLVSTEQLIKLLSSLGATLVLRDSAGEDVGPAAAPPPEVSMVKRSSKASRPSVAQPARGAASKARQAVVPIRPKKGVW